MPNSQDTHDPEQAENFKNNILNARQSKNIYIHFPWLSIVASLSLIGFLLLSANQPLSDFFNITISWMAGQENIVLIFLLGLIYWLDIRFFINKRHQINSQLKKLQQQLVILTQSKKKQQQRANTFSDHSEKLKIFISDKLLEYMEYDEKFIHFKGIASEVRHNGVISYDKVITALNKAVEQQKYLAMYEQASEGENEPDKHTINALTDYQSALDAMRYLWDLLDLSTADNMALHIGNQLIDNEEHYYQLQLDSQKALDITQSIPLSPTFNPQLAILMTFSMIADDIEIKNLIALAKINETILDKPFVFENERYCIDLAATPELLGNHNHIILLLENLIKNAQFFSSKNRYKQKTDRIIVRLLTEDKYARFSIYNRGPHIKPEAIDEIFKLGFSTRKNRQHHGKGLGLFFASEIVRGYQGSIEATNIENRECDYQLRLDLASGESIDYTINSRFNGTRMNVKQKSETEWSNELAIQSDIPIVSIQVKSIEPVTSNENIDDSDPIEASSQFEWLQPKANQRSQWVIQLTPFKNIHKLSFKPLDIQGVCFNIKIPTAKSHLEID